MKHITQLLLLLPVITLIGLSCTSRSTQEPLFSATFSTLQPDSLVSEVPAEKREIFYGILTPIEISSIFDRLGVLYTPTILNDVNNAEKYLTSSKASLNLGIYGVDLAYLKIFNMNSEMIHYMMKIRLLSNRLGIPPDYLLKPVEEFEGNMDMGDTDSLIVFMNNSYKRIEDHLGNTGQESRAGLIVLGGWIEALYIATEMLLDAENPDPEVVERIAEQKYTLNTMLSFLKNYYDDPVVVYYTKKLKFLKKYFNRFDIYFQPGDLEIDRSRQALRASGSEMTITRETLMDIKSYVGKMREETIGL